MFEDASRCLLRKERQRVALARGDAKLEMMARSLNNSSNSDLKLTTKYETTVLNRKEHLCLPYPPFPSTGAWFTQDTTTSDNDPDSCPRVLNHLLPLSINTLTTAIRIFEDDSTSVVEIRTENLQSLRELGPPDLVHLVKQPVKSTSKQVHCNAPKSPEARHV